VNIPLSAVNYVYAIQELASMDNDDSYAQPFDSVNRPQSLVHTTHYTLNTMHDCS